MPLFSHYEGLEDTSARLSYPSLIFAIVTPIVVIARLLGRRFLSGRIGADDWTILASCVTAKTVCIQMIIVCKWAFGKHEDDVPKDLLIRTLKLYFVAQILYKINMGLTKISILLLYLRLFVQRWVRVTCWTWIGIIVAFTTGTVVSSIAQCSPIQYAFDKTITPRGACINLTAFWYANAVFNITSDLVLIALPVPVISNLQLPLKSKIALCGIFAMGIFVCITSVLRITTLNIATSRLDITWNSIGSSMWTVIESNLAILCACLPALQRPLVFLFPRLFPKPHRSNASDEHPGEREGRGSLRAAAKRLPGWSILDSVVREDQAAGASSSQERIMPAGRDDNGGLIRKTTQVSVRYDIVGTPEGGEVEMRPLGK
ncbi:putative plasma membrane protein Pth11-like protein [Aspergillus floccosus]